MKPLKINKSVLSTFGLLIITLWSAVQYLFYSNVPEDISTFAFLFVTNVFGCVVLMLSRAVQTGFTRRRASAYRVLLNRNATAFLNRKALSAKVLRREKSSTLNEEISPFSEAEDADGPAPFKDDNDDKGQNIKFKADSYSSAQLSLTQLRRLKRISIRTVKKAAFLSAIQLLMNFFVILGSRNMDPVIISSVMSLYFVFVTPLLLLLRKKVSFRSGIGTVVALIALLLVFNANIDGIFSSSNVIFLFIADMFFAAYVVSISFFTEGEDPQAMAVVQMACCAVLSLAAWIIEAKAVGHGTMELSSDPGFWVSVLFIGIFIRALYSVIQFAAQKNVPPINASLIFASEIVITLILNPLLCRWFGTPYEPATVFQIVGCVLFVLSVLICDDEFMKKFNYYDMETAVVKDWEGREFLQVPLSRKIVNMNLLIGLGTLVFSTVVCLFSIYVIRDTVIDSSRAFGNQASTASESALLEQVEKELSQKAADKATVATERMDSYRSTVQYAADIAGQVLSAPESFEKIPVGFPYIENADIWTMQMVLADEDITYGDIKAQNEALGNLETLFASIQSRNPQLTTIYVGTEKGLLISYDPNSGNTDQSGMPIYYEFREADWYNDARTLGRVGFTDTYTDGAGRGLTITCFAPIYGEQGEFLGTIGMDFLQHDLNMQLVNVGIADPEKAVLVSAEGTVIAFTGGEAADGEAVTISESGATRPLAPIEKDILSEDSGLTITESSAGAYYVSFNAVESTGWKLCIFSPVENIIAPAVEIRDNIDGSTDVISETISEGIRNIIACCLVFFAVIVLLITYFVGDMSARITDPLKHLEKDVMEISQGNFNRRTTVETKDEIGSLARAFNDMTASLQHYIADLTEATAREERISSELSLARKIQADSLPCDYPAFPGRREFDLYFTMQPAKEVGGDFYDFYLIDDSHLALMIADVSGKGVPAALFMMVSKMLIKNRALVGGTPGEILRFANEQLCENNKAEMFVTAWLGILDLRTGVLTASNAGHEFPAVKYGDEKYQLYKDKHGLVLGGMEGSRYRDYTVQLRPGDVLFVYTDGVAEATNADNELFGTDRMLEALNSCRDKDCRNIINTVLENISGFVGEMPQFDDITMLCVRLDELMGD